MDEQTAIKNKLAGLTKKTGNNFANTDLETLVYEKKISDKFFVNTYNCGDYLTTVLIVVAAKNKQKFLDNYQTCLSEYNKNDLANWEKRTKGAIE